MTTTTAQARSGPASPAAQARGVSTGTTPTLLAIFTAAARSEWTKLRTVRSTIWALVFTAISIVGLGALLTALEVSRWDRRSLTEVTGFDPLLYSFAGINLAQLSVGVLGVLVMTSEYATGAIKLTLGATPQRGVVLTAKVATFSAVVAVVSGVSCLVSFLICQALLAGKHAGLSITDPGVSRAILGGIAHLVLIGAIAVGVGAALRRTAGAVAILFAVLLIVPGLVLLLPSPWNDDVTKYLPSSAGVAMSAVVRFPNLLSPLGGLLVLCGYAVATLLIAFGFLLRRDARADHRATRTDLTMTLTSERAVVTAAEPIALRTVFVAVLRSEWTKLRSVRSTIWALVFTVVSIVGLGVLFTALEVSRWDHRSASALARFDPLLYAFAGVNLAQLSMGVLGVLAMTSEYGTGAIKLTFGATPQRRLLLAAKVTTFSLVAAVVSLASCLTAFFICQQILATRNAGVSIADLGVLRAVLGAVLYLSLIGAIGVGIGAIVRHTAGSVAILFAVLLVIPGLVLCCPRRGMTLSASIFPGPLVSPWRQWLTYPPCWNRPRDSPFSTPTRS